jgi:hypothetical protein
MTLMVRLIEHRRQPATQQVWTALNRSTFRFRADAPVLDQRHAEDRIEGLLQIAYRCSNPAASECRCNAGLNALVLVSRCGWTPTTKRSNRI